MITSCPVCSAEVREDRDPLGDRILLGEDGAPHTCPSPRTFTITLPPGLELLNANDRPHWAKKARIVRELRRAAWACARSARIPRLERATVLVEYQPPPASRTRDAGNWAPTGKALIDGCRDAGVFPDDNSRHVVQESYRIGEPYPKGRIVLRITEAAGVTAPGGAA
jgi:hypothetical protein